MHSTLHAELDPQLHLSCLSNSAHHAELIKTDTTLTGTATVWSAAAEMQRPGWQRFLLHFYCAIDFCPSHCPSCQYKCVLKRCLISHISDLTEVQTLCHTFSQVLLECQSSPFHSQAILEASSSGIHLTVCNVRGRPPPRRLTQMLLHLKIHETGHQALLFLIIYHG